MAFKEGSTSFPDVCKKVDAQGLNKFRAENVWVGSVTYPILTFLTDHKYIERVTKGTYRKLSPEPLMKLVDSGEMKQSDVWENMRTRTPTKLGQVKNQNRANGARRAQAEPTPEPEPTPEISASAQLETALRKVEELPVAIAEVYGLIMETCVGPVEDLLDICERRMRQVENLNALLKNSKLELHEKSRKLEELRTQLIRVQQERLRVIPETKILIKDGSERQSPQWGKS